MGKCVITINGGASKNFTQKNLAFDCPAFQHHLKKLKSPMQILLQNLKIRIIKPGVVLVVIMAKKVELIY